MPTSEIYAVPAAESLSDLVSRIADRDQAAFGRFYRRLVRPVFAQIRGSLGGTAPAVRVTRAVFVEVWQLAPLFNPRSDDVLAWVTAIAARRVADRLRAFDDPASVVGGGYDGHLDRELSAALGEHPGANRGTTLQLTGVHAVRGQ
jgi:DNA-directed RNA polymerase specialized sigma24 family protein